jgi:hypothetical protein
MSRFGPTQIHNYAPRTPAIPYRHPQEDDEMVSPGMSMTPAVPGMMNATYAPTSPVLRGGGGSRFQQSLDNERAIDARSAQQFAAAAPLPATDAQSAYGSVDASRAARNAYVDRQATKSDLYSNNFYTNRTAALDANQRANDQSAAGVGYLNAMTGGVNAHTQLILPAQADYLGAEAGSVRGANSRADAMVPFIQNDMAAGTQGQVLHNQGVAAANPFIAGMLRQQVERGQLENQRYGQMTPGVVQDAGTQAELGRAQADKTRAEAEALRRPAPSTPADPGAAVDLLGKRKKLAAEEGQRAYDEQPRLWGFLPREYHSGNKSLGQLTQEAFDAQTPYVAPPKQQQQPLVEGSVGMHNGRLVKVQGGKWVYSN